MNGRELYPDEQQRQRIMDFIMAAGQTLLENGAEVFRVQQTMEIMARSFHLREFHVYVLTNGIFASAGTAEISEVRNVPTRTTHLGRVAAVNQLSRQIAAGGVTIDDCENLSRRMDKSLDEADPISQSYYFEVSSPGIGRDLVRPWHFERYLGEQIEVKLIRPMQLENGSSLREFVAPLCSCDDQTITVELDGQQLTIEKKDAAYIRLYEQISFK